MFFTRTLIARFLGPTWGPSGADRTQVGPMLAPWTLLSGGVFQLHEISVVEWKKMQIFIHITNLNWKSWLQSIAEIYKHQIPTKCKQHAKRLEFTESDTSTCWWHWLLMCYIGGTNSIKCCLLYSVHSISRINCLANCLTHGPGIHFYDDWV